MQEQVKLEAYTLGMKMYEPFSHMGMGWFPTCCEVTYSPVMGDYLTYKRNRAYDSDGVYPDENYAREIQQL